MTITPPSSTVARPRSFPCTAASASRRRFAGAVVAAFAVAGMGGCSESEDDSGSEGPPVITACGLPDVGPGGVPRPSGAPGGLMVLPWAGFNAAASYTFDDANQSQIDHYAELQALGVPMTFYLQTNKPEAANPIWAQAVADGHELGNHSHRHAQTATEEDIDMATEFIMTNFGVHAWTMAAPYGNASYKPVAETRFLINRGVNNGVIPPNSIGDPFNLPCHLPAEGASADDMFAQVESAWEMGGWRVLLLHGFTGGTDGAYQPVDIEAFIESVERAKALEGLWIDTVMKVGAYWRGHKAFAAVTPTEDGGAQTWSWTLPENFPPGQCLRVQVSGGTLSQGGTPLEWNEHGYYEVSLDAGSLRLAP